MTLFLQETDSKAVFAPPVIYPIPPKLQNVTFGGRWENLRFLPLAAEENQFREAWDVIRQLDDQNIAVEAKRLLQTLQEITGSFQRLGVELAHLPSLHAFLVEDGSVLLEWIFPEFRIGFSFESNPEESGWYLVSTEKLGEIGASGYLSGIELSSLIMWLVTFILAHP